MLLSEKRDYKAEILKILAQEGEIIGFNSLKKMGNFHPNRLKAHLDELEKKGEISIDRSNKREYVYSFITPKIEEKYQKITKKLKEIKNSLNNPGIKSDEKILLLSNYLKLSFYYQDLYRILILWPENTEFTKPQYQMMEKLQEKLSMDIRTELSQLSTEERTTVLNVILTGYKEKPYLMSLSQYREVTHKPTAKEKREQKIAGERYLQEQYEKLGPRCALCNDKMPEKYKDGDKHMEQHWKDIEHNWKDIPKLFQQFKTTTKKKKQKQPKSKQFY